MANHAAGEVDGLARDILYQAMANKGPESTWTPSDVASKSPSQILTECLARKVDDGMLGGVTKAAEDVVAARREAATAADALRSTKLLLCMDEIAFKRRQVELVDVVKDAKDSKRVEANMYFASWSKAKEAKFLTTEQSAHKREVDAVEREIVTRFAGETLLDWDWIGPLPWLRQQGIRLQYNGPHEKEKVRAELRRCKADMENRAMAFYTAKGRSEVVRIWFAVRRPSFEFNTPALNAFFRDIVEGANVLMKVQASRPDCIQAVGRSTAEILGEHNLSARALSCNLRGAVMVAFGRKFSHVAEIIRDFIPKPEEVSSTLRSLADQQRRSADQDKAEMERLLGAPDGATTDSIGLAGSGLRPLKRMRRHRGSAM